MQQLEEEEGREGEDCWEEEIKSILGNNYVRVGLFRNLI